MKAANLSFREIGRRLKISPSTVALTVNRFNEAGLTWPVPETVTDTELEFQLYGESGTNTRQGCRRIAEPDWAAIDREMRRNKHLTLQATWEEYLATQPEGYRYSRFVQLFRKWQSRLPVTMRQTHKAGEKLFIDYAGDGVPVVVDRLTGKIQMAQIFVAVLGGSGFTFAQATWTQTMMDWVGSHNDAFAAFGGVPALLVPDNTKVAVIKACHYEPMVNRTYQDLAEHYGTAILPARPRKPRDKAKVEHAVLVVERWLLGRLRHRVFYSLADVNAAIAELLTQHNETRLIRRLKVTRRQLLEEIDKPALKPLPATSYELAEWCLRRVGIDYHIDLLSHYYSVSYRYARAEVEVRYTARTVEIFYKGERIAVHIRMPGNHRHSTDPDHMPSHHRAQAGFTVDKVRMDAADIGPAMTALCERILASRSHPEQGIRACLGILRLERSYGEQRLEDAAARACLIRAHSYRSVKSILDNNLDRRPVMDRAEDPEPIEHTNIRGPRYYGH